VRGEFATEIIVEGPLREPSEELARKCAESIPASEATNCPLDFVGHALIQNEILPKIGALKVSAVSFNDIDRLHAQMTKRAPYRANRLLACLSKMFSLAIQWKWAATNPCKGISKNQEEPRERYLLPKFPDFRQHRTGAKFPARLSGSLSTQNRNFLRILKDLRGLARRLPERACVKVCIPSGCRLLGMPQELSNRRQTYVRVDKRRRKRMPDVVEP
jgi:hypothetical protein